MRNGYQRKDPAKHRYYCKVSSSGSTLFCSVRMVRACTAAWAYLGSSQPERRGRSDPCIAVAKEACSVNTRVVYIK